MLSAFFDVAIKSFGGKTRSGNGIMVGLTKGPCASKHYSECKYVPLDIREEHLSFETHQQYTPIFLTTKSAFTNNVKPSAAFTDIKLHNERSFAK